MRSADVLVFPSLRDFGGGVVFEALACGAVPVVVDFGGPGDIVHAGVGYKVRLTNEDDVVAQLESALGELVNDRNLLGRLRRQGMFYAQERLTWDVKAQDTTRFCNGFSSEDRGQTFPRQRCWLRRFRKARSHVGLGRKAFFEIVEIRKFQ